MSQVHNIISVTFCRAIDFISISPLAGDEVAKLELLEGTCRAAQDKFKHKKRGVKQMEEDMKVWRHG